MGRGRGKTIIMIWSRWSANSNNAISTWRKRIAGNCRSMHRLKQKEQEDMAQINKLNEIVRNLE